MPSQNGASGINPSGESRKKDLFTRFATHTARISGTSFTFIVAVGIIMVWAVTGPIFKFSDTWQLIINTGTTIVTFLMVFLIQNTQNRDSEALHLKIDELIRATRGAKNDMLDIEDMTQKELDAFKEKFYHLAERERVKNPRDAAELIEEAVESSVEPDHPARHTKTGASRSR